MEGARMSVVSEEDTPEKILENDNISEVTMKNSETSPESADPSASESTTEAECENQLRMFVTLLTARVLHKCNAMQNRGQEEWVADIKRLVKQTMEGLSVSQGFSPDVKNIKKVCKAVLKDLQKKLGGKRLLETIITLQEPAVDRAIVQSLQAHINDLSAGVVKKAASLPWWQVWIQVLAFSGCLLGGIILAALI